MLHRIEALPGDGRYAVTFRRPDGSEQTAVVQITGEGDSAPVDVAEASLPEGWSRDSDAFAATVAAVRAVHTARGIGPAVALLQDVPGGWDVMMGNVVLGDADVPTCTAHGPMRQAEGERWECAECGSQAAYAA